MVASKELPTKNIIVLILLLSAISLANSALPSTPFPSLLSNKECYSECGLASEILIPAEVPRFRAYGGSKIHVNSFPYVGILRGQVEGCKFVTTCTAVIISPSYLLTSGHCVQFDTSDLSKCELFVGEDDDEGFEKFRPVELSVFVGTSSITHAIENGTKLGVKKVEMLTRNIQSADIPPYTQFVDLAIIELQTALVFSEKVRPVCLPTAFEEKLGENTHFVGFGKATAGISPPVVGDSLLAADHLNEILVAFASPQFCNMKHPRQKKDLICAGSSSKGAAHGDSGGPLVVHMNGRAFLVGIASFIEASGTAEQKLTPASLRKDIHPDVFTRVSSYCDWIQRKTNVTCTSTNIQPPEHCLKYAEDFYAKQIGESEEESGEILGQVTNTTTTDERGYSLSRILGKAILTSENEQRTVATRKAKKHLVDKTVQN